MEPTREDPAITNTGSLGQGGEPRRADTGRGEPAAEVPPPSIALRTIKVTARVPAVRDALRVERAFGLDAAKLQQVEALCRSADRDLEQLPHLHGDPIAIGHVLGRVVAQLDDAERLLLEVDARVPRVAFDRLMGRSRHLGASAKLQVAPIELTAEILEHYASVLVRRSDQSAERLQRATAVLYRMLTVEDERGRVRVKPWQDVEGALRRAVDQSRASVTVRAGAIAFFRTALAKLGELGFIDEIFDSSFYVDYVGYELSLGDAVFDPDIVYAAAVFEAALHNKLSELIELEGANVEELEARICEAATMAASVFDSGEQEASEDISKRLAAVESASAGARRWRAPSVGLVGRALSVVAAVMVVGLAVGSFSRAERNENELVPLEGREVAALSGHLEKGALSQGTSDPIFVGQIERARWMNLSRGERSVMARKVAGDLAVVGVKTALVYSDSTVVIQIVRGQIIFVE